MQSVTVRELKAGDIPAVSKIHRECFPTDTASEKEAASWIKANFRAKPRFVYYVAEVEGKIQGYILWMELGGFRKKAVIELEQIGISAAMRGLGIGTILVKQSLELFIKDYIKPRAVELIKVTTGTNNMAQGLYKNTLGAQPECVMKNIYGGDELVMFSRRF